MCQRTRKISELSQDEKFTIQSTYLNLGMGAAIRKLNLTLGYCKPDAAFSISCICRECATVNDRAKEEIRVEISNNVEESVPEDINPHTCIVSSTGERSGSTSQSKHISKARVKAVSKKLVKA